MCVIYNVTTCVRGVIVGCIFLLPTHFVLTHSAANVATSMLPLKKEKKKLKWKHSPLPNSLRSLTKLSLRPLTHRPNLQAHCAQVAVWRLHKVELSRKSNIKISSGAFSFPCMKILYIVCYEIQFNNQLSYCDVCRVEVQFLKEPIMQKSKSITLLNSKSSNSACVSVDVLKTISSTAEKRAAASRVSVCGTACATEACVYYPTQRSSLNSSIVVWSYCLKPMQLPSLSL